MITDKISEGVQYLSENGYNLFSVTSCGSLPENVMEYLETLEIDPKKFPSLVVIGSGGRRLWEALHSAPAPADPVHPVNHFTKRIVDEFIKTYLDNSEIVSLFPGKSPYFSIQTFTHWLGWAHPTPLGKNLHKEFGLWHAYRSAFLTTLELPETPREMFRSPCSIGISKKFQRGHKLVASRQNYQASLIYETCEDKPCIKACPSEAVGEMKQTLADFDRKKCFTFRLKENSLCSDRCLARMACPVACEHTYTMPQMNHHYSRSRRSIIEKHNKDHQYGYATV